MTISSNVSYIHTYEWIVLSESPASYRLGQNHWPIPDRRGRRMSVSSVFLNMTEDVHQCEWGRRHIFIQKYVVFLFSIAFSLKNNICWYSIRLFLSSSEFKIQSNLNLTLQKFEVWDQKKCLDMWHSSINPNLYVDYGNMIHFAVTAPASEGWLNMGKIYHLRGQSSYSKMDHISIIYI